MLILAIGSRSDRFLFDTTPDLPVNQRGNIIVDQYGLTEKDGIFAGGDIVTGPTTVIEAVAAGKRAAAGKQAAAGKRAAAVEPSLAATAA